MLRKSTLRFFAILILVVLSAGVIFTILLNDNDDSKALQRHEYATLMHSKAAAMPLAKEEQTAEIPKPAHPDKAALQDYFMTVDPATGTVPRERLTDAYCYTRAAAKNRNDVHLLWEGTPVEMGGRTRAIMWDPTDQQHKKVWAGGVTGGLWFRDDITDNNSLWQPVDDFWSTLSISCITSDPNNPDIFYVGTGESQTALITYRESSGVGQGIWRSADAGTTWNLIESTLPFEYINDIVVRDEDGTSVIYAAVASGIYHGTTHQSEPSDGVFRSSDQGMTWDQVLPNIPGTQQPYTVSDLEITADGRIFAGTVQNVEIEGGAVILHSDLGMAGSWTVFDDIAQQILNSPNYYIPGRVMMAAAPSDPNVIYAAIGAGFLNNTNNFNYYYGRYIIKSTDAGESWTTIPIPSSEWATLSWHAFIIKVAPNNPDMIYTGGLDQWKTNNSGSTWQHITDWALMYYGGGDEYVHADQHAIEFNPGNPSELICGSDGGVFYTNTALSTYPKFQEKNHNYNTLQFYTCDIIPQPGGTLYCGGLQDNGTLLYQDAPLTINNMIDGGDGAFCFFDDDPQLLITSVYYNSYTFYLNWNYLNSYNDNSGVFINPADYDTENNILYANRVDFVGTHANQIIRFDGIPYNINRKVVPLQTNEEGYFSHLRVSPYAPSGTTVLFVGSQTGRLYRVENAQIPVPQVTEITGDDMPIAYLSCVAVGQTEDELLATFSNYGVPSVWQSKDGGESWRDVEYNLPDMPVRWAEYHPENDAQVMLATELGIWTTNNINADPVVWQPNSDGMANVRCDMLAIRPADNTVLAATHGRGLFTTEFPLDPSIGIPEASINKALRIYPNPATDIIHLDLNGFDLKSSLVTITNTAGVEVYRAKVTEVKPSINLSQLPAGAYQVVVTDGKVRMSSGLVLK
ncbi:MAG TPA: T9SS type A sorting domain-containing protein [Bacteroidales bacterium]|nr:T9SS type A sorting domain-containing protein [Bacteroidales bacterium]